ncbi:ArsR/SmtB family transcription factor [Primorskyibacter sp. S87]|uniref:ArsR/SmtB family transcription factor n=1 Tax=Primorskyibacter sp. S87 TaxID=3415126 RepID=UPI003C7A2535
MDQETAIEAFAALAQNSRLTIVRKLVKVGPEGLTATEISNRVGIVPSTLSGHLGVLKRAGLLTATRHSREIHYAADVSAITALVTFILSDCCGGEIQHCAEILFLLKEGES